MYKQFQFLPYNIDEVELEENMVISKIEITTKHGAIVGKNDWWYL